MTINGDPIDAEGNIDDRRSTCWCGDTIRLTSLGTWGHETRGNHGHGASPVKPVRRPRKPKED